MSLPFIETIERPKPWLVRAVKPVVILGIIMLIAAGMISWHVRTAYNDLIVKPEDITDAYQTSIVFGAGLKARGTPGLVLEDRVLTAIDVYQEVGSTKIVFSGDNSQAQHNEVQAMLNLAEREGLPSAIIVSDHAGTSTFETCWNAKHTLGLRQVVLITQAYHLPRALYICNELGLDAVGVDAARHPYPNQWKYSLREIPARIMAWLQIFSTQIFNRS